MSVHLQVDRSILRDAGADDEYTNENDCDDNDNN